MPRTRVLSEFTATLFILGISAFPVLAHGPDSNSVKTHHGPAERIQQALDSPATLHFVQKRVAHLLGQLGLVGGGFQ